MGILRSLAAWIDDTRSAALPGAEAAPSTPVPTPIKTKAPLPARGEGDEADAGELPG